MYFHYYAIKLKGRFSVDTVYFYQMLYIIIFVYLFKGYTIKTESPVIMPAV